MHQGSRTQERGGGDGSRDHCVRVDVGGNGCVGRLLLVDAPHLHIFSNVSKATKSQDVLTLTMCNYMARDRYPDTLVARSGGPARRRSSGVLSSPMAVRRTSSLRRKEVRPTRVADMRRPPPRMQILPSFIPIPSRYWPSWAYSRSH
jgi:hypothetical protein